MAVANRSAEDGVLCRGLGCPQILLFPLTAGGGAKEKRPKKLSKNGNSIKTVLVLVIGKC